MFRRGVSGLSYRKSLFPRFCLPECEQQIKSKLYGRHSFFYTYQKSCVHWVLPGGLLAAIHSSSYSSSDRAFSPKRMLPGRISISSCLLSLSNRNLHTVSSPLLLQRHISLPLCSHLLSCPPPHASIYVRKIIFYIYATLTFIKMLYRD